MRLFGLIGYPLSHSFSKQYFDEKFKKENLTDCQFENFPISSIDKLKHVLDSYRQDLKGLAVTIPYKRSVLDFLNNTENIPRGLNACNCIKILKGKLIGYNTDVAGFEKSIRPLLKPLQRKALVLGNGGAAEAVVFALQKLDIDFKIVSRKIHNGSHLTYSDLTKEIISEYTIIINTTPLGMYPDAENCPLIPYEFISENHLLYDLIYNPEKTLFLKKGEEKGAVIKNGLEMLITQAEENWMIWNNNP
ncbi:MAG TPA: shikimate dehydrogenase [Chitinophagaceae bacterium]|nr:shikimate dehydrogenase [Chitinophagaceae bacterium]